MLSEYISENVIQSVKCYFIGKTALGPVDIVVCTNNGYVVEYAEYKLKRKCAIECCNAESIEPFSSYEPNHKFYLIKAPNLLIVVIRGDKLKLLETYTSVQKFYVRDFYGKGYPMVGIWTKSSETPHIVTNFADKCEVPEQQTTNAFSGFLIDKLQEIRKVTRESELKLAEKQELRLKSTRNLEETLARKFQPEIQEGVTSDERFSQVYLESHWHRIHNEKWVLGATITNRSKSELFDIKMLLSSDDDPNLCFCTRVVQFEEVTQWKNLDSLSADSTGHILTILEMPRFMNNVVMISVTVTCKIGTDPAKVLQIYVPPYKLHAEDVARNLNTTFVADGDTEDVLSVLAASEKITLFAKWQRAELRLHDILVEKLHFVEYAEVGCFFNSGRESPGLAGIMVGTVQQTSGDYTISVFSRTVQQLYLFISLVYAVVPLDTVAFLLAEKQKVDCDKLREAFIKELKLVKGLLPEDAMVCDSDDIVVSYDVYSSFRKQFSLLELNTDILASGSHQSVL